MHQAGNVVLAKSTPPFLCTGAPGEGDGGHTGQLAAACVQAYIGVGESQGPHVPDCS